VKRRAHATAVALLWLVPVATAADFLSAPARAGHALPDAFARHFDASGRADDWASPRGALLSALEVEVFMLALFSLASIMLRIQKPRAAWPTLVAFALVLGGLAWQQHRLLVFNVHRATLPSAESVSP